MSMACPVLNVPAFLCLAKLFYAFFVDLELVVRQPQVSLQEKIYIRRPPKTCVSRTPRILQLYGLAIAALPFFFTKKRQGALLYHPA